MICRKLSHATVKEAWDKESPDPVTLLRQVKTGAPE